jgi:hypothetical protein
MAQIAFIYLTRAGLHTSALSRSDNNIVGLQQAKVDHHFHSGLE